MSLSTGGRKNNVDAALLTALGAFITGVLGLVIAAFTWRSSATKSELDSLRATILLLQKENDRLRQRQMEGENDRQRLKMRLDELEYENGNLKEWAETLVTQVIQLGGHPVKLIEGKESGRS